MPTTAAYAPSSDLSFMNSRVYATIEASIYKTSPTRSSFCSNLSLQSFSAALQINTLAYTYYKAFAATI
jgi:hypothetical protein